MLLYFDELFFIFVPHLKGINNEQRFQTNKI